MTEQVSSSCRWGAGTTMTIVLKGHFCHSGTWVFITANICCHDNRRCFQIKCKVFLKKEHGHPFRQILSPAEFQTWLSAGFWCRNVFRSPGTLPPPPANGFCIIKTLNWILEFQGHLTHLACPVNGICLGLSSIEYQCFPACWFDLESSIT